MHRLHTSSLRARSALLALATAVAGTLAVAPVAHASETIWVSPSGADTADGSSGAPLRSLGAAIARARTGDRIVLRGGTYHESVRIEDTTLDITSAPGERAVFDGASPLTSFTRDGDDWAAALTTDFAVRTGAPVLSSNPAAGHPDQVFLDGAPLTEVLARDQVVPGTFFHDVAAGRDEPAKVAKRRGDRSEVVDEQAHLHARARTLAQQVHESLAGRVVAPDVEERMDAVLGAGDRLLDRVEGHARIGE